jgi:hypothetical protein
MLERGFSFQPINDVEGQYTKGDYVLFPRRTDKAKNAEIKTEEENPNGNLFIEKWSDKRPERERPGWLYNLTECNLLFYIFLKLKIMYMLDFQALRTFDFSKYDEVPQTKQVQNNLSTGYLVPTKDLREAGIIKVTHYFNGNPDEDNSGN